MRMKASLQMISIVLRVDAIPDTLSSLQVIPKRIWRTSVSTSTSRRTMSSPRSSRTSCSISIKPSRTLSTRRCTSCRPTASPARASSRRSMRSKMSMRTGRSRFHLNSAFYKFLTLLNILDHHTIPYHLIHSWNKLTDRFFKTSPWPEAEAIASLVGNGE